MHKIRKGGYIVGAGYTSNVKQIEGGLKGERRVLSVCMYLQDGRECYPFDGREDTRTYHNERGK